ncbi:MAG: hypothetical protein HY401_07950 [Elusimicrobia bacterium]|nr:hypothetical protein [Elusimicrobiota bacterium]
MSSKNYVITGGLCLILAACGGVKSKVKKGEVMQTIDQESVTGGYVESIGIGGADPALPNQTQRRSLSRDAAIAKAQFEMLSMVKKIEVEGGTTVQDAISKDSTLETRLQETLSGAEILKTEWTNDDGCVVTMRIPKKRLESMMGIKFK